MKRLDRVVNSVDPDQMQHFLVSDLGPHHLLRPVCTNTKVIRVSFRSFFIIVFPESGL